MITQSLPSRTRQLNIDFDQYTDGDPDFKIELTHLLIGTLEELHRSVNQSLQLGQPDEFSKAKHKAAVAVDILADAELIITLGNLENAFKLGQAIELGHTLARFNEICRELVQSLHMQLAA